MRWRWNAERGSAAKRSVGRRLAGLFHGRPRLQVGALLAGPVGWLVVGYLGSLAVLLVAAFWTRRPAQRRGRSQSFSLDNFETLVDEPVYRDDRLAHGRDRRPGHAHRRRSSPSRSPSTWPRWRAAAAKAMLVVAVLMPLWSSYLVKVYAWRTMLSDGRRHQLGAGAVRAARPRLRQHRRLAGDELPLAAVHDPADLRRARADPELADQRLRGPRRLARSRPSAG